MAPSATNDLDQQSSAQAIQSRSIYENVEIMKMELGKESLAAFFEL